MKLYDRILGDSTFWKRANWYDSLSEMDRHDVDMAIGYGRDDNWEDLNDARTKSAIRRWMRNAVVIDASNVAAYCNLHGFDPHVVPSYLPPFEYTWFETSKPYRDPGGFGDDPVYQQVGAIATSYPLKDGGFNVGWHVLAMSNNRIFMHPEQVTWMGDMMQLDERGNWHCHSEESHGYWHEAVQSSAVRALAPFLMAIGFTHCKNVEMVDAPETPYKVRRKQELKLGHPLVRVKELIIDPSRVQRRVDRTGMTSRDDMKHQKALHIARGHFAHYTDDRPLFGKYTGTFWRPAHVRGSADVGTVYKDYVVKGA